jgi:hypothetical protein
MEQEAHCHAAVGHGKCPHRGVWVSRCDGCGVSEGNPVYVAGTQHWTHSQEDPSPDSGTIWLLYSRMVHKAFPCTWKKGFRQTCVPGIVGTEWKVSTLLIGEEQGRGWPELSSLSQTQPSARVCGDP